MSTSNTTPAPEGTEAPAAPTGMKAKLPMIAMVAVGLAIGGGTGAAFVGPMFAKKFDSASDATHGEAAPAEGGGHGGPAASDGKSEAVHIIDNLVLNPAGSGGSRFLLLSVALEGGSPAVATEMTARDAELRDIILTTLGSKTVDQLIEMSVRDSIKSELITVISARFGKGAVKRLYFPTFVVQ